MFQASLNVDFMKKRSRNILLGLVLIVFFVLGPLLILYAFGYRYDRETHTVRQTAIIGLDFQPEDVDIYLDGEFLEQKKEKMLITGLTRGSYLVDLKKDGYHTWSQKFIVEPGLISWAEDLILFLEEPNRTPVTTQDAVTEIVANETLERAATLHQNTETKIVRFQDADSNTSTAEYDLASILSLLPKNMTINFGKSLWVPGDQWFIVPFTGSDGQVIYIALATQGSQIINLESLVPRNSEIFTVGQDNTVAYTDENDIPNFVNVGTQVSEQRPQFRFEYPEGLRAFLVTQDADICLFKEGNTITNEYRTISEIPCSTYKIEVSPNKNIALESSSDKALYLYRHDTKEFTKLIEGIERFQWASKPTMDDVLSYQTSNELWAFDLNDEAPNLLTRTGGALDASIIHPQGSHIFFTSGDKLSVAETRPGIQQNLISWEIGPYLKTILHGSENNTLELFLEDKGASGYIPTLIQLYE